MNQRYGTTVTSTITWQRKQPGTSSFSPAINAAAFKNPDGEIVAVVLNHGENAEKIHLRIEGITAPVSLPGRSLSTFVISA